MVEVLEAVDKLTLPARSKILQDGPVGSGLAGQQVVTVVSDALLVQLEAAIRGTIGIGGSGSLPSERNMLDSDALHRFAVISSTIRDWATSLRASTHPGDSAATLRAWYVAFRAVERNDAVVRFHLKKLLSWVGQIEAKLDPPRVRDLPDPCPKCEATDWFNPVDKLRYLRPLRIEYRPTGPDMIQEARARCQSCGEGWAIRQLAFEIEEATRRKNAVILG